MVDGSGLNFELINRSAQTAGVRISYAPMPWKRCLAELQANRVDGAFAASYKTDRLELGAFPGGAVPDANKRLHTDSYVLVRKKGSAVEWNGKTIQGLDGAVGVQLGYSVGDQLRAMQVPVDDGSGTVQELLLKLLAGRVAAAAIGGGDAKNVLNADRKVAGQLELLPIPLVEKHYFLMLSHALLESRPALASALWKGIETARKSQVYQRSEANAFKANAKVP
ncbi:transporter substrate-binding domain-containing protein [Curvibacter sp. APW13]|uniref:substrate-binding periplasmic protein n=1 Tax=Curvibacter sp. APW13 TaxID=3077236 RepID=UPI0028E05A47|nr:transporter substrate-binding domain-containing protein [Curvibacter sp. APW13]MDT8991525.1 transporter substrate-binding domain-containing protein [Curvibacter sp. APW13]